MDSSHLILKFNNNGGPAYDSPKNLDIPKSVRSISVELYIMDKNEIVPFLLDTIRFFTTNANYITELTLNTTYVNMELFISSVLCILPRVKLHLYGCATIPTAASLLDLICLKFERIESFCVTGNTHTALNILLDRGMQLKNLLICTRSLQASTITKLHQRCHILNGLHTLTLSAKDRVTTNTRALYWPVELLSVISTLQNLSTLAIDVDAPTEYLKTLVSGCKNISSLVFIGNDIPRDPNALVMALSLGASCRLSEVKFESAVESHIIKTAFGKALSELFQTHPMLLNTSLGRSYNNRMKELESHVVQELVSCSASSIATVEVGGHRAYL